MHVYNFALKFQTMAEKTAKNLRGLFFAAPCIYRLDCARSQNSPVSVGSEGFLDQ